jgi:hypothetical protein
MLFCLFKALQENCHDFYQIRKKKGKQKKSKIQQYKTASPRLPTNKNSTTNSPNHQRNKTHTTTITTTTKKS